MRSPGTWGRRSARNRVSMRLGQRVESLLDGVEITDAERRHSGIGGHVTQSYEELPSDFNFDIDDRVSFSARNALPERKKNRGVSYDRLSCTGWGPLELTRNGPVVKTEVRAPPHTHPRGDLAGRALPPLCGFWVLTVGRGTCAEPEIRLARSGRLGRRVAADGPTPPRDETAGGALPEDIMSGDGVRRGLCDVVRDKHLCAKAKDHQGLMDGSVCVDVVTENNSSPLFISFATTQANHNQDVL